MSHLACQQMPLLHSSTARCIKELETEEAEVVVVAGVVVVVAVVLEG